ESFGMAIGEAFANGVPVLTTTGVPWPMIAASGCGWRVEPTVEGMIGGLRDATSLDSTTLDAMGERGQELVKRDFSWENIARQFVSMYSTLHASCRPVEI